MIYDRLIRLGRLTSGSPLTGTLTVTLQRLGGFREVYSARFWSSVQAGSRVDLLLELPRLPSDGLCAEMYAVLPDGHVCRVEQAQETLDENNVPIWLLSLRRMEGRYDLVST